MAGRNLGTLTIDLVAKTGSFIEGLDKAGRATGKFKDKAERDLSKLAKSAGLAAAAIGTTLYASLKAASLAGMQAVDSQAKLAKSLNTTYTSITQLNKAFSDGGINDFEGSLNRLNRRLGAAELGRGAALKAVQELNLDLKELSKSNAAERVAIIADRIKEVATNSQTAARYTQDLGFEQKEAAQFFMQGGNAIRDAAQQVERYGLAISEVEAHRIEEAAGIFGILKELASAAAQSLAAEFAPSVTKTNAQLHSFIENLGGVRAIVSGVVSTMRDLVDVAAIVGITIAAKVTAPLVASSFAFLQYQYALASVAGGSAVTTAATAALSTSLIGLSAAARAANAALAFAGGLPTLALAAAGTLVYFGVKAAAAKRETELLNSRVDDLTKSFDDMTKIQAQSAMLDVNEAIKRQRELIEDQERALAKSKAQTQQFVGSVNKLGNAFKDQENEIQASKERLQELEIRYQKLGEVVLKANSAQEESNEILKDSNALFLELLAGYDTTTAATLRYNEEVQKINETLEDSEQKSYLLGLALTKLQDALTPKKTEESRKSFLELLATYDESAAATLKYQREVDDINASLITQEQKTQLLELAQKRLNDALKSDDLPQHKETFLELLGTYDSVTAATLRYNAEIDRINNSLASTEEKAYLAELALKNLNDAISEPEEQGYWDRWLEGAEVALTNFDDMAGNVLNNFTTGFGSAMESMIFDSNNFRDAMANLAESMLRNIVNALGQMAAQWIVYQLVVKASNTAAAASGAGAISMNALASQQLAALNAYASTAAIPIVGAASAPVAAATALAATTPYVSAATSAAYSAVGMAHDGIDYIPKEGTWILDKGERVVDRRTNEDLKNYLSRDNQTTQNTGGITVILNESAERAGQVKELPSDQEKRVIEITVANIRGDGQIASALQSKYHLEPKGF